MYPSEQIIKPHKQQEFLPLMIELVRLFSPHTYVEIGVKNGYTFNAIAPLVKRAVAVDVNGMKHIKTGPTVELWHMPSQSFAKEWTDPIDFLFIDANHRYEAVSKDFYELMPYVRWGSGLVFLHDTHPVRETLMADGYCSNAWKFAQDIRRYGGHDHLEIVTLPGPWAGLSIIRKSKAHLAWME